MISFKLDKVLVVLLVVYSLALASTIDNPHHADESTHSFVGLFLKDLTNSLVKNPTLSFNKIYDYAISYLVFYPKISLHYPPLPQFLFSIAYEIFGVSLQASRFVIILISLAFVTLIYYFTYILFKNRNIALLASSMMMTSTIVINMSILAMQELPFAFFFTLTMLWLYLMKDRKPNIKQILILSILVSLAILTKWQSLTILPVLFVYTLFFQRKYLKRILLSFVIVAALLAPYYFVLWKTNLLLLPLAANLEADPNDPTWMQLEGWTYYLTTFLQDQFFLPVGIIILLAVASYFLKKEKDWKFFATWILVIYLIMVIVHNKDPRYTINFLPAFVIPASYVIYKIGKKGHTGKLFLVIVVGLLFTQATLAFSEIIHGFPDVVDIARYLSNDKEGNVLIDTGLGTESPFIFEIAKYSKFDHQVFRPCTIEFLDENFADMIDKFGIKYMVVDKDKQGFTQKQKEFSDFINKKGTFSLVNDFSRFSVLKNNNYTNEDKDELCNYVCATKSFVCTKFKNPNDVLK